MYSTCLVLAYAVMLCHGDGLCPQDTWSPGILACNLHVSVSCTVASRTLARGVVRLVWGLSSWRWLLTLPAFITGLTRGVLSLGFRAVLKLKIEVIAMHVGTLP